MPKCKLCRITMSKLLTLIGSTFARGNVKWDAFEWVHVECFPKLIQLACLLPWKEDNLRSRISKVNRLHFLVFYFVLYVQLRKQLNYF